MKIKTLALALLILCFVSFVVYATYTAIDNHSVKPLELPALLLVSGFTIRNLSKKNAV